MTRRTTITLETERLLVISQNSTLYGHCAECGNEVRLLTVAEAAVLARVSWRAIFRKVEAGALHFLETRGGVLLICGNSLNDSH